MASTKLRIPFYDIDPTGVAWHGQYFKYLEVARCALLEDLEYSYEEMKQSGCIWPVVDASVRYVRPLTLHQEVRVVARLKEWELRLVVDYTIEDDTGFVLTRARTVQVPVDAKTKELMFGSPDTLVKKVQKQLQMQTRRAK